MSWLRMGIVVGLAACSAGGDKGADDTDPDTDTGAVDSSPGDTGDTADTAPVACVTTNEIDSDGDGTPDQRSTSTFEGARRTVLIDSDGDGTDDRRLESTWVDEERTTLKDVTTYGLPGEEVIYRERSTVDPEGRVTRREQDADADGTIDVLTLTSWGAGAEEYEQEVITDEDDDGTPDTRETRTQDAEGRVTRTSWDEGADGTREQLRTWTYAGLVTELKTFEPEGTLVEGLRTTANAAGDPTFEETDADGDGTYTSEADHTWKQTWRSDGQPEITELDGLGEAPDGVWDERTVRTYDGAGLLRTTELESAGSGVYARMTFTYDGAGHELTREDDLDADGTIVDGVRRTVDADGNPLTVETLEGGVVVSRSAFTWQDGRETSARFDTDADGTPDRVRETERDAHGRPVHFREDRNGDGTWEYDERWTYSCPPGPGEGPGR
ncbi:MAG: hypothetical protein H6732_05040 [Alphaproteobacteria bacterium]|nr:hypothetical protein [Alphaproteobacteria bacterium]